MVDPKQEERIAALERRVLALEVKLAVLVPLISHVAGGPEAGRKLAKTIEEAAQTAAAQEA